MTRNTLTSIVLPLAALWPGLGAACSVCGPGTEESRMAFMLMTAFMTFTPLLFLGSLVWYLRHRAQLLSAAEETALLDGIAG